MLRGQSGFTLIELITVIVIISILTGVTTSIITRPIQSYMYLQTRTTQVDNAESALQMMQRDIRRAVPNSIRITSSGTALELLHTTDGGRYRAKLTSSGIGNILDFTTTDSSFDVIGSLSAAPTGSVVIYNLGDASANAYAGNNVATLSSTSTATSISLATATQFPLPSPLQRFFIVDTPITYSCSGGSLLRYFRYPIAAAQANPPVGATAEIQANSVNSCAFTYASGAGTRSGLVTLQITLVDSNGESLILVHQVHVDNAP
jgi:MSHA biogenesis protein MshO